MSILSFPAVSGPRPARPSLLQAVEEGWIQLIHAWQVRRADRAMHLLSDEMLHDIGVSRGEIEEVTRRGRPTAH